MKRTGGIPAGLATLLGLLLLVEAVWFVHVLDSPRPLPRADLLAVYGGLALRYEAGWAVEREGSFRYLVFSDAAADYVRQMEKRFGAPRQAHLLLEPDARTTDQNARYVARLARQNHCASVLVISSWWHLPRALLLTHLALLGSGVDIQGWAADDAPPRVWGDLRVWIEYVRVWGSLLTFASDGRHSTHMFNDIFAY